MDKIKANAKRVTREHKELKKNVSHSLSRYGLVKYDAFNDVSGNLSFAIALLDENGSGLVLNSMHSRESCYTYAKEIIEGKSFVPLSEEEQQAIDQAQTIDDEIDALTALAEAEDYMNYTDEAIPAYVEENAAYYENLIPPEE
jgi:Lon protease-like protein